MLRCFISFPIPIVSIITAGLTSVMAVYFTPRELLQTKSSVHDLPLRVASLVTRLIILPRTTQP